MTDNDFNIYRDGRYERATKYYDGRANKNRRWHRFSSIYIVVTSIAIAPLLSANPFEVGNELALYLSPTIAILTGIAAHFRFHESWLSYRSTWDSLQHELPWRNAEVAHYKGSEDRNALFVERVESLISQEGDDWLNRHSKREKSENSTVN